MAATLRRFIHVIPSDCDVLLFLWQAVLSLSTGPEDTFLVLPTCGAQEGKEVPLAMVLRRRCLVGTRRAPGSWVVGGGEPVTAKTSWEEARVHSGNGMGQLTMTMFNPQVKGNFGARPEGKRW